MGRVCVRQRFFTVPKTLVDLLLVKIQFINGEFTDNYLEVGTIFVSGKSADIFISEYFGEDKKMARNKMGEFESFLDIAVAKWRSGRAMRPPRLVLSEEPPPVIA